MPLHNWSHQDAEVFHDFHNRWTTHMTEVLNLGLLPGEYFARSEAGLKIDDIDSDDSESDHRISDVDVIRDPFDDDPGGAVAIADAPPQSKLTIDLSLQLQRQRRVAVRRGRGDLVAVIEVISHGNLAKTKERLRFAEKCVRLIESGVHVVILDLHLKKGRLAPIEDIIAEERGHEPSFVRENGQALITSIHTTLDPRAYFDPLDPGESLPSVPLFLTDETYVPLPLEATYTQTFDRLPRRVKAELTPNK